MGVVVPFMVTSLGIVRSLDVINVFINMGAVLIEFDCKNCVKTTNGDEYCMQ
jgi:hypothetical protein